MSSFKDMPEFDDMRPKMSQKERDEKMKKFLEKGGKVEKLKPGYPINVGSLDKSKKPRYTKEDVKRGLAVGKTNRPNYDTYKPGSYHDFDVGGDNPPEYIKPTKNETPIK